MLGIFPKQASDTGPGKYSFGNERTAEQEGNIKTNNGDERQNCITQYMLEKYVSLLSPFGVPCNEIHAKHFQNAGAQIA